MALEPGARLGPYRVTEAIGVGGMGEVYRAVDTGLKRDVAVKVLPGLFAADTERLARFQREAEVLATFNHPNIAQVYGLEKTDAGHALVMELVEGPTLAERIARGALSEEEALAIATQIASALEAAHGKGVVHRDLKPANVKLRSDGTVKVLDFGIAKALAPSTAPLSAVTELAMTQTGFVLGTPAYMSPEQARGAAVDGRSDIWAFGCVLFEMLTGRPPFTGEHHAVSASALNDSLPTSTSAAIRRTLALCLQSDLRKRIADIRDVRLVLEGDFETGAAPRAGGGRWTPRALWLGAGAVCGGALAAAFLAEPPLAQLPELRLQVMTPSTGAPLQFALSPDGRYLAFVASDQGQPHLWLRSLAATDARPIAGTENARAPFWSPDSRSIGFFAAGNLNRVSVAGGAPQKIVSTFYGAGATWNKDGGLLFASGVSNPLSYRTPSGEVSLATSLDEGQAGHRFPQFLPDGRLFLFYVAGQTDKSGVFLGSLDGGEPSRLTAADSAGAFLAPNWVFFVQQGSLIAQRLDLSRHELIGDPAIVIAGVGTEPTGNGGFSVSASGQIAVREGDDQRSQLTWRDRTGAVVEVAAELEKTGIAFPELSPDDRYIAAQRTIEGNWDVWLLDLTRGGWTPLTRDPGNEQLPVWSPDATRIAYSSNRSGPVNLYLRDVRASSSDATLVVEGPTPKQAQSWSTDGAHLLYYELGVKTRRDLWSLDVSSGEKSVFVNGAFEERGAQFAPGGRWVAYETDASGRYEVVVQSFPQPTTTLAVSTDGGTQPRWSADGKEIYFVSPDLKLMAARVTATPSDGATLEVGEPGILFPVRIAGDALAEVVRAQYAVSRDGRFLINESVDGSADDPITLILNWRAPPDPQR